MPAEVPPQVQRGEVRTLGSCRAKAADYEAQLKPLLSEYEEALALAGKSSRISLAPQVASLQELRRRTAAVEYPECAAKARDHLLAAMERAVDAFLAFMGQEPDTVVNLYFTKAGDDMRLYRDEMLRLANRPAPPRP